MSKPRLLIQLDPDSQPSSFDAVVAIDGGAEHLLQYGGVRVEQVRDLVYGAIFTRGVEDLASTAIFIGGRHLADAEALRDAVAETFFGPMRVSVMLDAGGANTTAAAAVLSARKHGTTGDPILVLGGTGAVGQRVARLLAQEGYGVRLASRDAARAQQACQAIRARQPNARITPAVSDSEVELRQSLRDVRIVIAAGAPGVCLLPKSIWSEQATAKVLIDLNAVPPYGIEGVEPHDREVDRDGIIRYGALGVGRLKMKLHKQAIIQLFQRNDQMLDAEEIFRLGDAL